MTAIGLPTPKGETFEKPRDGARLGEQFLRVLNFVTDGQWHTLAEISKAVGAPEASVSARLRDIHNWNKGWVKQRKHMGNGLFAYRFVRAG